MESLAEIPSMNYVIQMCSTNYQLKIKKETYL